MRNYIIYFLTSLFLLFVVESKLNVKTLRSDFTGKIAHNLPQKTSSFNHTSGKITVQQSSDTSDDFSLELTEDDFQLSDTFQTIAVFASVFGLIYDFSISLKKRLVPSIHNFLVHSASIKKFILIRSIRI